VPSSRPVTRSRTLSRAVRKRIRLRIASRRNYATTSHPSLLGNMTSTMRRSNLVVRASFKPASPSRARSTENPASRKPLARKAAVFFSSSITRIRIAQVYKVIIRMERKKAAEFLCASREDHGPPFTLAKANEAGIETHEHGGDFQEP